MASEGGNVAIALAVLFIIGLTVPLVVNSFYDTGNQTLTGIYSVLETLINDGISFLTFDIDIFFFLGDDAKTFIVNQIKGYHLFAETLPVLANAIIIIIFILLAYAIVKALPTT